MLHVGSLNLKKKIFHNPKTLFLKFLNMAPVMTEARTFRQMYWIASFHARY